MKHSSVAVTIPSKKTVPIKVFGSPYIPNFDAHQNQNDDLVSSSPTIDCKNGEIINEQHDAHVDGRNMINKQKIKISEFGAFTYNRGPDTEQLWGEIPSDTHVLITHGPAKGRLDDTKVDLQGKSLKAYNHHDESQNPANVGGKSSGSEHEKNVTGLIGRSIGCEVLGRRIAEIKPWLHVCGHVHESRVCFSHPILPHIYTLSLILQIPLLLYVRNNLMITKRLTTFVYGYHRALSVSYGLWKNKLPFHLYHHYHLHHHWLHCRHL